MSHDGERVEVGGELEVHLDASLVLERQGNRAAAGAQIDIAVVGDHRNDFARQHQKAHATANQIAHKKRCGRGLK